MFFGFTQLTDLQAGQRAGGGEGEREAVFRNGSVADLMRRSYSH